MLDITVDVELDSVELNMTATNTKGHSFVFL